MERKYSMQKREDNSCDHSPSFQEGHQDHPLHHQQESKRQEEPIKMSSPEIIEDESHTFSSDKSSTLTEDSVDHQEEKQSSRSSCELSSKQEIHEEEEDEVVKVEKPSSLHPRKRSNKKANDTDVSSEEKIATASQPSFSKSKSYSNGGSLFRNWITCGAIDTNDSAMFTVNRRSKTSLNVELSTSSKTDEDSTSFSKELLLKGDKLGGSQRVSSTMTNWLQTKQSSGRKSFDGVRSSPKQKHEFCTPKAVNPAYKPMYGPQCSQCGKPFKPEKMHAHMKSCKGMKAWTRYSGPGISATAEKAVKTSAESQNNLIPGHCLSHSIDFGH